MGKKKSTVKPDNESPVILTATTREELAEKFSTFASQHEGATLTAGAVGRNAHRHHDCQKGAAGAFEDQF